MSLLKFPNSPTPTFSNISTTISTPTSIGGTQSLPHQRHSVNPDEHTWKSFHRKSSLRHVVNVSSSRYYSSAVVSSIEAKILLSGYRGVECSSITDTDLGIRFLQAKSVLKIRQCLKRTPKGHMIWWILGTGEQIFHENAFNPIISKQLSIMTRKEQSQWRKMSANRRHSDSLHTNGMASGNGSGGPGGQSGSETEENDHVGMVISPAKAAHLLAHYSEKIPLTMIHGATPTMKETPSKKILSKKGLDANKSAHKSVTPNPPPPPLSSIMIHDKSPMGGATLPAYLMYPDLNGSGSSMQETPTGTASSVSSTTMQSGYSLFGSNKLSTNGHKKTKYRSVSARIALDSVNNWDSPTGMSTTFTIPSPTPTPFESGDDSTNNLSTKSIERTKQANLNATTDVVVKLPDIAKKRASSHLKNKREQRVSIPEAIDEIKCDDMDYEADRDDEEDDADDDEDEDIVEFEEDEIPVHAPVINRGRYKRQDTQSPMSIELKTRQFRGFSDVSSNGSSSIGYGPSSSGSVIYHHGDTHTKSGTMIINPIENFLAGSAGSPPPYSSHVISEESEFEDDHANHSREMTYNHSINPALRKLSSSSLVRPIPMAINPASSSSSSHHSHHHNHQNHHGSPRKKMLASRLSNIIEESTNETAHTIGSPKKVSYKRESEYDTHDDDYFIHGPPTEVLKSQKSEKKYTLTLNNEQTSLMLKDRHMSLHGQTSPPPSSRSTTSTTSTTTKEKRSHKYDITEFDGIANDSDLFSRSYSDHSNLSRVDTQHSLISQDTLRTDRYGSPSSAHHLPSIERHAQGVSESIMLNSATQLEFKDICTDLIEHELQKPGAPTMPGFSYNDSSIMGEDEDDDDDDDDDGFVQVNPEDDDERKSNKETKGVSKVDPDDEIDDESGSLTYGYCLYAHKSFGDSGDESW